MTDETDERGEPRRLYRSRYPASSGTGQGSPLTSGRLVFGLILVVVGGGWLLAVLDIFDFPWRVLLSISLIGLGVVLTVPSWRPAGRAAVTVGVGLVFVLAIASTAESSFDIRLEGGIGQRTERPNEVAELADEYRLAIGQLTVDLRRLNFPNGETRVEASVGLGQLVVTLPDGVAVWITASSGAGELNLLGQTSDGLGVDEELRDAGFADAQRRLTLDLRVGFGQIEVRR